MFLEPRAFSPGDPVFLAILDRAADIDADVSPRVAAIIREVRTGGEAGLLACVRRFDAPLSDPEALRVAPAEIAGARRRAGDDFLAWAKAAVENVEHFHRPQVRRGYVIDDGDGVLLGKRILPLARIGVYCPAGTAPLFSSIIMNVVPAKLAGVGEIALAIPPDRNGNVSPEMLAVADLLGIDEIWRMGGAHAVAALAYGAGPVRRVDKIVGPGNAYVAAAKRQVFGAVGIDTPAGPSEIAIIADSVADPRFVAADLLSQAEHGSGYEAGVVLTDSAELARAVAEEAERRLSGLSRGAEARRALSRFGAIFIVADMEQALDAANVMAPEHLELMIREPARLLPRVVNAGAVFLGPWSPEPVGDYFAGTNHVLPTAGSARFASSLGVADFQKDMSILEYSRERLRRTGPGIALLARAESLSAHADAIEARLEADR